MRMKNGKFGGTIRFKKLMKNLNNELSELSDLVIHMIECGYNALNEDNEDLYREIEKSLEEVHDRCYFVEDSVQSSLALHQPFASDLRYILSALKNTNEIHRSAHDAVHIAHSTKYISLDEEGPIIKRIVELAKKAADMFERSITAFKEKIEVDFDKWQKLDDEIDNLHKKIINDITETIQKNPSWTRSGVSLILSTRYIERIADHACNIVEESNFVVTGKRGKIE